MNYIQLYFYIGLLYAGYSYWWYNYNENGQIYYQHMVSAILSITNADEWLEGNLRKQFDEFYNEDSKDLTDEEKCELYVKYHDDYKKTLETSNRLLPTIFLVVILFTRGLFWLYFLVKEDILGNK